MATYLMTDRAGNTTTMTREQKQAAGPRWVKAQLIKEAKPAPKTVAPAPVKGSPAPVKPADDKE